MITYNDIDPNGKLIHYLPAIKLAVKGMNPDRIGAAFTGFRYKGVIYPKSAYAEKPNQSFIMGNGYISFEKKDIFTVPAYSGLVKDFKSYMKDWGGYCMFHSLTGEYLDANDASSRMAALEFTQFMVLPFNKILPYMARVTELDNIVKSVLHNHFRDEFNFNRCYKEFKLLPTYYMENTFIFHPAFMDASDHDNRLILAFIEIERTKLKKPESYIDYFDRVIGDIKSGKIFPISIKERIETVYGKRASELYESLFSLD